MCALTGHAQTRALLTGFAVMPADTFAEGPPSGAWIDAKSPGTPRFSSQPVQGLSSLWPADAGEWWALSDNGFGAKTNSSDYLLRIYRLAITWGGGSQPGAVSVRSFIQLSDPDRKLPFPITRANTSERWLTGADLDPESMVKMSDGAFWIGDEFGPFLLHFGPDGRLLSPPYENPKMRSPDHPHLLVPDAAGRSPATVRRSRGFEGLAHFGAHLYALIEADTSADPVAVIHEFDLASRAFTGQSWPLPLAAPEHGATEIVSLSTLRPDCGARFLVIVRDDGHGSTAKIKRVLEVRLAGQSVVSQVVADLLRIDNPNKLGGHGAPFTFPFITPEAVWPLSRSDVLLANDNNFPAGGGRAGYQRDPTEFIRLSLPTPLCSD